MANALCSAPLSSFNATPNPDNHFHRTRQNLFGKHNVVLNSPDARFCRFKAKAARSDKDKDKDKKPKSMKCADCDGNGKVLCSQCQGSGVNSVDIFNGRFKRVILVGFAEGGRRCCVEIAMELASLGVS